ncbi:hypothetical protein E8E12_007139 [Didymella heteroderae]|uniref:Uncharacterized protein n=1 Tax=Didymella heteroderae TaxID=1769908 RepID=A0A9P5BZT2_9PLEO|nr:hypothetical protein E8E12_007139 [Didymella heteroderae]
MTESQGAQPKSSNWGIWTSEDVFASVPQYINAPQAQAVPMIGKQATPTAVGTSVLPAQKKSSPPAPDVDMAGAQEDVSPTASVAQRVSQFDAMEVNSAAVPQESSEMDDVRSTLVTSSSDTSPPAPSHQSAPPAVASDHPIWSDLSDLGPEFLDDLRTELERLRSITHGARLDLPGDVARYIGTVKASRLLINLLKVNSLTLQQLVALRDSVVQARAIGAVPQVAPPIVSAQPQPTTPTLPVSASSVSAPHPAISIPPVPAATRAAANTAATSFTPEVDESKTIDIDTQLVVNLVHTKLWTLLKSRTPEKGECDSLRRTMSKSSAAVSAMMTI